MRRVIILLSVLALFVLLIRSAGRLTKRCGCVEGCTCRDMAVCRCQAQAG